MFSGSGASEILSAVADQAAELDSGAGSRGQRIDMEAITRNAKPARAELGVIDSSK